MEEGGEREAASRGDVLRGTGGGDGGGGRGDRISVNHLILN